MINKKSTERQKRAVKFCEEILKEKFKGDLDDFNDVSCFLSEHLESAKALWEEMVSDWISFTSDSDTLF